MKISYDPARRDFRISVDPTDPADTFPFIPPNVYEPHVMRIKGQLIRISEGLTLDTRPAVALAMLQFFIYLYGEDVTGNPELQTFSRRRFSKAFAAVEKLPTVDVPEIGEPRKRGRWLPNGDGTYRYEYDDHA